MAPQQNATLHQLPAMGRDKHPQPALYQTTHVADALRPAQAQTHQLVPLLFLLGNSKKWNLR